MAQHQVISDYTNVAENAHVKVFVRARPPQDGEPEATDIFELGEKEGKRPRKITVKQWREGENWGGVGGNTFLFDGLFWDAQQEELFEEMCREQVDRVLEGYDACCFAYGQTGSGKTHSMFFPRGGQDRENVELYGIIPRAVEYLFTSLAALPVKTELHVSFLEIYCDAIRDLGKASLGVSTKTSDMYREAAESRAQTFGVRQLTKHGVNAASSSSLHALSCERTVAFSCDQTLKTPKTPRVPSNDDEDLLSPTGTKSVFKYELNEEIREDANGKVFVKGLARLPVKSCREAMDVIDRGLSVRATEATSMNDTSSRSHTVFTVEVTVTSEDGDTLTGKLHLVDLAGSERLKKSESEGIRLKEALSINKSLTALGKVIVSLDPSETKKGAHVPYRDSKLTRLLSNALGGDSYTTLLATIRPTAKHAEECLSTLQFANRCRRVANKPRVHRLIDSQQKGVLTQAEAFAGQERIRSLQRQVAKLQDERQNLMMKLAAATGEALEEVEAQCAAGGSDGVDDNYFDEQGRPKANPAVMQGVVSQAVLSALRELGLGESAHLDQDTGGVKLKNGQVLLSTLPAAFVGHTKQAQARMALLRKEKFYQQRGASVGVLALGARVARVFGWSPSALPPALVDVLVEAEFAREKAMEKLRAIKGDMDKLKSDTDMVKAQAASEVLKQQTLSRDNTKDCDRVKRQLFEERDALIHDKEREIASILHIQKRPTSASVRKKPGRRLVEPGADDDEANSLRDELDKAKGRVRDCERTIVALKQQYEHWLHVKDRDAHAFITQLNTYRLKKRSQLQAADRELSILWRSLSQYQKLAKNLQTGKYPLHQLATQIAAPKIPRDDKPPLLTLHTLPATKRALDKLQPETNPQPSDDDDTEPPSEPDPTQEKLWDLEANFEAKVRTRLEAELRADSTVGYVRSLEAKLQLAEQRAAKEAKLHAQLRIAYLQLTKSSTSSSQGVASKVSSSHRQRPTSAAPRVTW